MSIDNLLHQVYTCDAYFQPTPSPVVCRKCGTRLKAYYAEARLYAVKCGYCESITLVKASHPTEAARYVGEYASEEAKE